VPRANDEVARLGRTFNSLLDRLQAVIEHERRMLDDASHELRTPLSILKAELDLALARPRTPAELEAALLSASEEADRLAALAEDLLVLSKAQGGELRIHRVRTPLRDLLDRACAGHQARAGDHGVQIDCHAPAADVMVDPMRMRQALDNVLDNAIRHSGAANHAGTGRAIRVRAEVAGSQLRITVANDGPGFAPDILPQAFEPFVRAERGGSAPRGAGLGLTIVRAIAAAHGGTAIAANVPGGARLTMVLALDPDAGSRPAAAS